MTNRRSTRQGRRSNGSAGTVVRGVWSIACQTFAAHEVSHPVGADRNRFSGQVVHHPAAATAGILQVKSIDPGHDPEGRCPLGLLGLPLLLVLALLAPGEHLAGTVQQLSLPLAHLDRADGVVSRDLLDRLAAINCLQGGIGLNSGLRLQRLLNSC